MKAAEKAACIARACRCFEYGKMICFDPVGQLNGLYDFRQEEALFQLLVEEKTGSEKNAKFDQDFKTLADVLIQETVKNEVGKVFPQLQDNILGEESNKFTNKLGNSLTVEIKETSEGTKELLVKVLDDNQTAGKLLADQVNNPNVFFFS